MGTTGLPLLRVVLPKHCTKWKKKCETCAHFVKDNQAMRCDLGGFWETHLERHAPPRDTGKKNVEDRMARSLHRASETLTNPKSMMYCIDARDVGGRCGPTAKMFTPVE